MVYLSKGEMETARGTFHAQLSSVMDTLLAAAVCEIAKIFESSLREHQAALLQKTNEISLLRSELDQVKRCAESVKGADVNEKTAPEGEPEVKQEPEPVDISDGLPLNANNQSTTVIKEEGKFLDEAVESKHNENGSQSNLGTVHVSEMHLPINQKEHLPLAQSKDETHHWDQSNLTAAQQHEEDTPSSPVSLSPKVRSDTSRTEGWLPGLNSTQDSAIENFQSNKPIWSGSLNRPSEVGVDENLSDKIDGTFGNQESENPVSSHDIIESAQRGEGGIKNHTRQGSTFRSRDRPQSNYHTFAMRNMDCLGHHPGDSGVIGRPYTCPYCAKCFAYPSHQRRHLLRHTGVRLHSCQFCDKRFLTPSELTVHTRTHTGERPFGCGQCGKRFARSGNLRAHQRDVHLGKRPFACTECGKKFAHKGNLRVHHHRVHHGQRYYLQEQQSHIDSDTV